MKSLRPPCTIQNREILLVEVAFVYRLLEDRSSPAEGVPRKQTSSPHPVDFLAVEVHIGPARNQDCRRGDRDRRDDLDYREPESWCLVARRRSQKQHRRFRYQERHRKHEYTSTVFKSKLTGSLKIQKDAVNKETGLKDQLASYCKHL